MFDDFGEGGFAGEGVHDPLDDGELEADEVTLEVGKAGAGDFGAAFFVDPAAGFGDLVVVFGGESELGRLADGFDDLVLFLGVADGDVWQGGVGDFFEEFDEAGLDFFEFVLGGGDFDLELFAASDFLGGRLVGFTGLGEAISLFAEGVEDLAEFAAAGV